MKIRRVREDPWNEPALDAAPGARQVLGYVASCVLVVMVAWAVTALATG